MISVLRREFEAYFSSLMGFGIISAFVVMMMLLSLLLDPLGGGGDWFRRGELSMRTFFGIFPWVAAVVIPAVTMRLWAEDRRQATFALLMTLPMPTWKVALAKYFAGVAFVLCMLGATIFFPIMLSFWGSPDWGPVAGGYVACAILGAAFVAVGLFVSGLTDNQALAFFLGMLICLGIVGIGELRGLIGDLAREYPAAAITHLASLPIIAIGLLAAAIVRDKATGIGILVLGLVANGLAYGINVGAEVPENGVREMTQAGEVVVGVLGQISVLEHFGEIERGVVNTNGLVFFGSYIVLFVLLNVWSLESRRYT